MTREDAIKKLSQVRAMLDYYGETHVAQERKKMFDDAARDVWSVEKYLMEWASGKAQ